MHGDAWMHHATEVSVGVSITSSVRNEIHERGPTAVTVASYEGTYQEFPIPETGIRRQVWIVDMQGTIVTITVEAQPDTTAAQLAEAHAIIESIRREPFGADFGLTFSLPEGWDSG